MDRLDIKARITQTYRYCCHNNLKRQLDKYIVRQINIQLDRQIDEYIDRYLYRQIRWIDRQLDRLDWGQDYSNLQILL